MENKKSCFYCTHLILDGMNSWCEIHKAGAVCEDYKFNKLRYERAVGHTDNAGSINNNITIDLGIELISTELTCISCGKFHSPEIDEEFVEGEHTDTSFTKVVLGDYKCPYCGCNTFDIDCLTRIYLK